MGERQPGDATNLSFTGLRRPLPPGERGRRPTTDEIGAQPFGPGGDADSGHRLHDAIGQRRRPYVGESRPELVLGGRPRGAERLRIGVERQPSTHGFGPHGGIVRRRHVHRQPEAIEQLGPELALLGVHGSEQHEAGSGGCGETPSRSTRLTPEAATSRSTSTRWSASRLTSSTYSTPPCGVGQQAGAEAAARRSARAARRSSAADQAVLGGAERQLDERGVPGQQGGQARARVVLALPFSPRSRTPPMPGSIAAEQQRQLGLVLADHGREREAVATPSSALLPPFGLEHGGAQRREAASAEADHSPRSSASSRRSAMAREAPTGWTPAKNFRICGSAT